MSEQTAGGAPDRGVVGRYLATMQAHDWDAMAACLAPDVVRVGPYGDSYSGRPDYVRFLAELLPSLPGYSMEVERIEYAAHGALAVAELSETVEVDGRPLRTPEALVFEIEGGLVSRIRIYIQTPPPAGWSTPAGG